MFATPPAARFCASGDEHSYPVGRVQPAGLAGVLGDA